MNAHEVPALEKLQEQVQSMAMAAKTPPVSSYTPESFKLETKLIVLNFLGINPHDSPSHSEKSKDLFRRFCHSLPVTPDFNKRCNHLAGLRKQKTLDHLPQEDRPQSSSTIITEQKIPRRKARSLKTVNSEQCVMIDNHHGHVQVTKEEISVSCVHSPNRKRNSFSAYRADDELSGILPPSNNLNSGVLFPDNLVLNPESLFPCHQEPALITPKSAGFEPSFEDWKNFEPAMPKSEENGLPVNLTENSKEMDEIVDSLLCDVVKVVMEREVKNMGICTEVMDSEVAVPTFNQYDSEENREKYVYTYSDSSSATMSSSSVSIDNSGPSPGSGDSMTSHEIDGCCCIHFEGHTHSASVTPGDRSKLHLHIVNQACPAVEGSVEDYMRAEIREELSSLQSEIENVMKQNGEVVSPLLTPPLTPQTHAARVLARIGDEVRAKYEFQLDDALYRLFLSGQETFSYEVFRDMACQIVDHNLPGWRQVAFLLVYGQSVAWRAVETGHTGLRNLIDYTTQLLSDYAADFIIHQGGWGAVMNIDSSDSTPDLETDHPLHAKQFTGQSYTFYESVTLSIKATDIFPNHQNITCNNSSFQDPEVMSVFTDHGGDLESLPTDTSSQSSSEEQQVNYVPFFPYLSSQASETDYYAERFRDLNDIAYHRFYNNDRLADMVMMGVNVLAFFGIIFLSENMKYL